MTPPPGRRSASAPPGTSHAHQGEAPPGLRPSPTCKVGPRILANQIGYRAGKVFAGLWSAAMNWASCCLFFSASLAPAQLWSSTYSSGMLGSLLHIWIGKFDSSLLEPYDQKMIGRLFPSIRWFMYSLICGDSVGTPGTGLPWGWTRGCATCTFCAA
ncbi:hypothetical protein ACQJBY_034995 [Aegilops geniculata]